MSLSNTEIMARESGEQLVEVCLGTRRVAERLCPFIELARLSIAKTLFGNRNIGLRVAEFREAKILDRKISLENINGAFRSW